MTNENVPRSLGFRQLLVIGSAGVALASIIACAALIGTTTLLRHISLELYTNQQSVRVLSEAKANILMHVRSKDPLVRRDYEANLLRELTELHRYVTTPGEERLLTETEHQVQNYVRLAHQGDRSTESAQESAYMALEALIELNQQQSSAAHESAVYWNSLSNILGSAIAALLLLTLGVFLWWINARGFRPVLAITEAMARFGRGDRSARIEVQGLREFRETSSRFNEMASELSAQRDAQMTFLAAVAHDLRGPLTVLSLSVNMVRPDRPLPPEQSVRMTIERVSRQIARLDRMIDDFLDMARIEAGELELKVRSHEARPLVREAADLFAGVSSHRLTVSLSAQEILVDCDALRIEQVITNLISNAVKYSPSGGPIDVALEQAGNDLVISVADRGVGISKEEQLRLFEPFRRVGLSKEIIPGVGLGLFVVRRIVEAHRGRIEVQSEPGQGTTFKVFLPTSPANHSRQSIQNT